MGGGVSAFASACPACAHAHCARTHAPAPVPIRARALAAPLRAVRATGLHIFQVLFLGLPRATMSDLLSTLLVATPALSSPRAPN
eukprot:197683-Pleurochrysis_carterae.AAC.2